MSLRNYSSTAAATTLSAGVDASTTTLTVTGTTGFPAVPFILAVDAGAAAQELVLVTNVAGLTLTVTRAYDSTVATAHSTGAVVAHSHGGIDFREANTHVNATSAVHGTTSPVVGTQDTQTLVNKTLSADSNTLNGFAASSFVVSDATGKADGSAAQKVIPAGAVVGTTDAQTLTNKTLTSPVIEGSNFSAFTPSWTSTGTAPSLGNGTLTGRSVSIGKLTTAHYNFVVGSTTTTGTGSYRFSLPVNCFAHVAPAGLGGWFYVEDVGGIGYAAFPRFVSATTFELVYHSTTTPGALAGTVGATSPFGFANADFIRGYVTYEAA